MKKNLVALIFCLLVGTTKAQVFFGEKISKQDSVFNSLAQLLQWVGIAAQGVLMVRLSVKIAN